MSRRVFLSVAFCCLAGSGLLAEPVNHAVQAADRTVSFNWDIRPILSDKCLACHGQDANARDADLRLDTFEGATADLGSTRAVVPGDPENSQLWIRVTSEDEYEVMPPPGSHKRLSDSEKALLKQWILEGAPYENHWAFEPIRRPDVPQIEGAAHPIDALLAAARQPADLPVQPLADREILIRRVALALTGLPPTIDQIDAYLADQSPQAYEHMVDRLLDSPHYGQEMARHWLDLARYADTHGLHLDNERQMWAYRDWVVRAFNENLPFDQFTIWQIAGDLLPDPSTEQLVATGFNRCNVTTSEGGAIDAEFTYRYAVERTSTVAQAWLGLTAGCAVCHDHKYDPLTTQEFYSLYAFFNSAADPAMDRNINTTPPVLRLPTAAQRAAAGSAAAAEQAGRQWLDSLAAVIDYQDPALMDPAVSARPMIEVLFDETFPPGSVTRSSSRNAIVWQLDPPHSAASGRRVIRQASAADLQDTIEFKLRPVVVPRDGRLEVMVWIDPLRVPESFSLTVLGRKTIVWRRAEGGFVREGTTEPVVAPGAWTQLTIPTADCGLQPGDRVDGVQLAQSGGVIDWDRLCLVGETDPATDPLESLAAWRRILGKTVPPELPGELHPLIQDGPDKQWEEDKLVELRKYYVALVARPSDPDLGAARQVWEAAREARIIAEEAAPVTFIYRESDQPRESFVMLRGQYDAPGEQVKPGIPAVLPQIAEPTDRRLTRLDLARWLVAPEHPLTARVTVNRLWQQFFGVGLVATSDDFGTRGEPPTHPDLLDYLADEFRESGWDVKRFVKLLVTSDAFRRDSRATPELLAHDPGNRWYARGPRFRLDAEQIRDNALFVSGLIDLEMGGPGVRPYQPPNIWEPVGYSDSNTRFYLQDHGPALYRRSLYVFLKRTAPPPFMSNFDGPNREQSCTRRERSNTPLQALQLMNDVQHVEAARALAERVLSEGGETPESRVAFLYRTVLSRQPTAEETRIVLAGFDRQQQLYRAAPEEAGRLIRTGESPPRNAASAEDTAAWTMIANLILNTDETLNRN